VTICRIVSANSQQRLAKKISGAIQSGDHLYWTSFSTGGYRRLTPRFLPISI
jgi:hypothetical protein